MIEVGTVVKVADPAYCTLDDGDPDGWVSPSFYGIVGVATEASTVYSNNWRITGTPKSGSLHSQWVHENFLTELTAEDILSLAGMVDD